MYNDDKITFTTAQGLGQLRAELIDEGFDPSEAYEIVMTFVRAQADDGFGIETPANAKAVA